MKMDFIEAVKAKVKGKDVRFSGNAYDTINPQLIIANNDAFLRIGNKTLSVPVGCIESSWYIEEDNWALDIMGTKSSKKTLEECDCGVLHTGETFYREDHIKTFIQKLKEDLGDSDYLNGKIDKRTGKL